MERQPNLDPPRDADAYDRWFRDQVNDALQETGRSIPHAEVMAEMRQLIEEKRAASRRLAS